MNPSTRCWLALLLVGCRGGFGQSPVEPLPFDRNHPNEPEGFTTIIDQPCEELPPALATADSDWWSVSSGVAVIEDEGSAHSGGAFWRTHLDAGTCCDTLKREASRDFRSGGGATYTAVYVSLWLRHSSNWVPHPISSTFAGVQLADGLNYLPALKFDATDMNVRLDVPFDTVATPVSYLASGADAATWLGEWKHYELLMEMNTGDNADGVARIWVDGVLVLDESSVVYASSTFASNHEFTVFDLAHSYGGSNGSSAAQDEDLDDIYVSVR